MNDFVVLNNLFNSFLRDNLEEGYPVPEAKYLALDGIKDLAQGNRFNQNLLEFYIDMIIKEIAQENGTYITFELCISSDEMR